MSTNSPYTYLLIQRLTDQERKKVKKHLREAKPKSLNQLFNALLSIQPYSRTKLENKVRQTISRGSISPKLTELKTEILHAISSEQAKQNDNIRFREYCNYSDILIHKGLFKDAHKQIGQLFKLLESGLGPGKAVEANLLRARLHQNEQPPNIEKVTKANRQSFIHNSYNLYLQSLGYDLLMQVAFRVHKSTLIRPVDELEYFRALKGHQLFKQDIEEQNLIPHVAFTILKAKISLHTLLAEFEEQCRMAKISYDLLQPIKEGIVKNDPKSYVVALDDLATSYKQLEQYENMHKVNQELFDVLINYCAIDEEFWHFYFAHRLDYLIKQNDPEKLHNCKEQQHQLYESHRKSTTTFFRKNVLIMQALTAYHLGNNEEAENWFINIENNEGDPYTRKDLEEFAEFLAMLVKYEQAINEPDKKTSELHRYTTQKYHKYRQNKDQYPFEYIFADFLRQTSPYNPPGNESWENLRNEIHKIYLTRTPYVKHFQNWFDFEEWVKKQEVSNLV